MTPERKERFTAQIMKYGVLRFSGFIALIFGVAFLVSGTASDLIIKKASFYAAVRANIGVSFATSIIFWCLYYFRCKKQIQ